MRAIVLAAGAGSRLWPYTVTRPKPMVPIGGKPILGWILEALSDAGIRDVQLVVGYKASRIQTAFQDGRDLGLDISYVHQSVLLGSGAALSEALTAGGLPDQALVLGGDNLVDASLISSLLDAGLDALAVARAAEPSKYGVVRLQGDHVEGIEEKPLVQGDALVSTGATLLSRESLDQVPKLVEQGQLGLAHILDQLARDGGQGQLRAVVDEGLWLDAVYPWDLLNLTERLLSSHLAEQLQGVSPNADVSGQAVLTGTVDVAPGATIEPGAVVRGPTTIGANATIASGAVVSGSVIMDDAVVGPGSVVERSVVGDGTRVHGGVVLARGTGVAETTDGVQRLKGFGALLGEGCTVEGGSVVLPATIVGNGAHIRAGARARGRVSEDGEVS